MTARPRDNRCRRHASALPSADGHPPADAGVQLAFPLTDPRAVAVPRPAGLEELELEDGGVAYLVDTGDEHPNRVAGWYYGYPACCVEAFVTRRERPTDAPKRLHPVSGHVLCPACDAGPPALLPPRPAERFGWAEVRDGELLLTPPSARGRDRGGGWGIA